MLSEIHCALSYLNDQRKLSFGRLMHYSEKPMLRPEL